MKREELVQIVDKDKAVCGFGYAGNILHAGQNIIHSNVTGTGIFHNALRSIHHQGNRQRPCSGNDELISRPDFSFRLPEALSHIYDRNNLALDIQNAEDNIRRFGERGYGSRPDDPFHSFEAESILLCVKIKYQQARCVNRGILRKTDGITESFNFTC